MKSSPYSIRSTKTFAIIILAIAIFLWAFSAMEFTPDKIFDGMPPLFDFISQMYPPDVSVAPTLLESAVETIQMVLVGTLLGTALAHLRTSSGYHDGLVVSWQLIVVRL